MAISTNAKHTIYRNWTNWAPKAEQIMQGYRIVFASEIFHQMIAQSRLDRINRDPSPAPRPYCHPGMSGEMLTKANRA